MAERPQDQPEGGRRLALAGPGVDDQEALLDRLGGDLGVLHRLALLHLRLVALGVDRSYFTAIGRPATMKHHAVGERRHALVEPALLVAEAPRRARSPARCRGRPRSRRGRRGWARAASAALEALDLGREVALAEHQVGQPQRQAVDEGRALRPRPAPPRASSGASSVRQRAVAARPVEGDALAPSRRRGRSPSRDRSRAPAWPRRAPPHGGSCPSGRRRAPE